MGSFYDNVLVTAGIEPVVAALEAAGAVGLALALGPELTVVYPKEPAGFRRRLSRELDASLLWADMHDSDVLSLCVWRSGEHIHDYCNCPEYFASSTREVDGVCYAVLEDPDGTERLVVPGVDGAVVEPFLPFAPGAVDTVRLLAALENRPLDPEDGCEADGYIFANVLHRDAMTALGLPAAELTTGFRYLSRADEPQRDYSRYAAFGGAVRPDPERAAAERAAAESAGPDAAFFTQAEQVRMMTTLRGGPRDGEQLMVPLTAVFNGVDSGDGGSYRPDPAAEPGAPEFHYQPGVPTTDGGWPEELTAGF